MKSRNPAFLPATDATTPRPDATFARAFATASPVGKNLTAAAVSDVKAADACTADGRSRASPSTSSDTRNWIAARLLPSPPVVPTRPRAPSAIASKAEPTAAETPPISLPLVRNSAVLVTTVLIAESTRTAALATTRRPSERISPAALPADVCVRNLASDSVAASYADPTTCKDLCTRRWLAASEICCVTRLAMT